MLDPGTDYERVQASHSHQREAVLEVLQLSKSGASADLMKRLPDGTLTTEF